VTVAVLLLLAQGVSLEVRAASGWLPWPMINAADSAVATPVLDAAVAWRDSASWIRVGTFDIRAGGSLRNSVAVLDIDPRQVRFSLGLTTPDSRRSASEWMNADTTLLMAVNTGLFRENGTPQGLVLIDGRRASGLAGWLDVVVAIDSAGVRVTDLEGGRTLATPYAFQTLPWLVRNGRVALGATSGLRLSRTHRDRRITLCWMPSGMLRFMLSNFEVFGANAGRIPIGLTIPEQAAIAAGAGCRDAIALDGGISAQIAYRANGRLQRMPGWRKVPLMLLIHRR